jgi:hypothetical protein
LRNFYFPNKAQLTAGQSELQAPAPVRAIPSVPHHAGRASISIEVLAAANDIPKKMFQKLCIL